MEAQPEATTNNMAKDGGRIMKRLIDVKEFMRYTGLSRNTANEFGEKIGCRRKIGRRVLFDVEVAGRYLDDLAKILQM